MVPTFVRRRVAKEYERWNRGTSIIPKLEAHDIRLEYFQPRTNTRLAALDGVNLEIAQGEFASIVGPSGCGKTSFLFIVDGLLPATAGRVLVDGRPASKPGRDRAVVFQDASLLPWRTVLANVCYGLECLGIGKSEARKRASHLIDMVGLSGFEQHYPYQLSGGMQQRVVSCARVGGRPRDSAYGRAIRVARCADPRGHAGGAAAKSGQRARKTVLFVTHQIDEAIYLSDRVVVFCARPGKVKEIIPVPFERPRPLRLKLDDRFHAIEDRIWSLIEEDVKSDRNRGGP